MTKKKTLADKVRAVFDAEGVSGSFMVGQLLGMAWGAALENDVPRSAFLAAAERISSFSDADIPALEASVRRREN